MLFAGAAESDVVQDRDVVANLRRLTDDESRRVIDKDAAAEACRRMDIDREDLRDAALQVRRQFEALLPPKPVGDAMPL